MGGCRTFLLRGNVADLAVAVVSAPGSSDALVVVRRTVGPQPFVVVRSRHGRPVVVEPESGLPARRGRSGGADGPAPAPAPRGLCVPRDYAAHALPP